MKTPPDDHIQISIKYSLLPQDDRLLTGAPGAHSHPPLMTDRGSNQGTHGALKRRADSPLAGPGVLSLVRNPGGNIDIRSSLSDHERKAEPFMSDDSSQFKRKIRRVSWRLYCNFFRHGSNRVKLVRKQTRIN